MKKLKFLVLTITLILLSCERDDICAETTSTTPRLIIEFYDVDNNDVLKNVPRLTVYGEGLLTEPPTSSVDETLVYNDNNTNSIALPLLIGEEESETTIRFVLEKDTHLRLDDDVDTNSNEDILEISYTSEYVYVSRACGYKSVFNDIDVSRNADGDTWISSIETLVTEIENENNVHVYIYH
ncbi:DUF6452 family protein [Winogradskyella sp. SYSU M77433]|uniref:DUF6452 family protein n=1 Tax=Winogradskyella sp. SYSU M77433 TaxID=3042722 RepID=UPI002480BDB6|nr:DUF6452 family protein [Winogradskyella sp. SYSU M77433]MDH7912733.1 DUF6452 family protein [Winogradskyella sp. SYSU M77433]